MSLLCGIAPPRTREAYLMPETFGQMLRRLREERRLTQVKLGELIGDFSHVAVGDWERGKRTPEKRETVIALAMALGTDVNELLLTAGYAPLRPDESEVKTRSEILAYYHDQPLRVEVPEDIDADSLRRMRTIVQAIVADEESATGDKQGDNS